MSFAISGQSSANEQALTQSLAQQKLSIPQTVQSTTQDTDATEVDPKSRSTFQARFPLNGAAGTQFIIAKLSSNELDGVSGVMDITINK